MKSDIEKLIDQAAREGRVTSRGVNLAALTGGPAVGGPPVAKLPGPRSRPEWDFTNDVIDLAHSGGWLVAHFRPAKVTRNGVEKYETPVAADGRGFLDLLMLRDRVVVAELKCGTNKPSKDQLKWMAAWRKAGVEPHLWYPLDWKLIVKTLA